MVEVLGKKKNIDLEQATTNYPTTGQRRESDPAVVMTNIALRYPDLMSYG